MNTKMHNVHANVAVLKQYQMCFMIFAFNVHLEHIKNLNKVNCQATTHYIKQEIQNIHSQYSNTKKS